MSVGHPLTVQTCARGQQSPHPLSERKRTYPHSRMNRRGQGKSDKTSPCTSQDDRIPPRGCAHVNSYRPGGIRIPDAAMSLMCIDTVLMCMSPEAFSYLS